MTFDTLGGFAMAVCFGIPGVCVLGYLIGFVICSKIEQYKNYRARRKAAMKRIELRNRQRREEDLRIMNSGYIGKPFTEADI